MISNPPLFRWISVTRTLFVALVVLDLALVGPRILQLFEASFRGGFNSPWEHGVAWAIGTACLILVLATMGLWWVQSWLTSRSFTSIIRRDMLSLVAEVLMKAGIALPRRDELCSALERELKQKLSLVEYRPFARFFSKPSIAARGNVLVVYTLAKAVTCVFGRQYVPECAHQLEMLPSQWLGEQPVWKAAAPDEQSRAEAITLEICPLPM